MNLQFKYILLLTLILGVNSRFASCQTKSTFDYEHFKKSVRNEIELSKNDSLVIKSSYNGDIEKYLNFRRNLKLNSIQSSSWERQSFNFKIPVEELKLYSKDIGIDSPYYFYAFITHPKTNHPIKFQIIEKIKNELKDTLALIKNNLSLNQLVNLYSKERYKDLAVRYSKIIHSIKHNPTEEIIEKMLYVNIDEFAKNHQCSIETILNVVKSPSLNKELFDDLMEVSKKSSRENLNTKDAEKTKQFASYQYFLFMLNLYSFNEAGGYTWN